MPLETDGWGNNLYTVGHCRVALTNHWAIFPAPVDFLERHFEERNLDFVSPAQLGFLRAKDFSPDLSETIGPSVTNTDVFYDGGGRIILMPDGAITKLTGLVDLVNTHKQWKEYVIPENQRGAVYSLVEEMLRKGTAFCTSNGTTSVETSEFGLDELTSRLFADERLGIKAQEYGRWLKMFGINKLTLNFADRNYAISQGGPFVNRLYDEGTFDDYFDIRGYRILGSPHAYGVRFESIAEK